MQSHKARSHKPTSDSSKKLTIAVLMGGRSAEHEVSLLSARNVINALDQNKYHIIPVGISRDGKWWLLNLENYLVNADDPQKIALSNDRATFNLLDHDSRWRIDVVFPVLHGTYGEDGAMQGFLEICDLPYVGPDTSSSATCFDKVLTKIILSAAGIAVAQGFVVRRNDTCVPYEEALRKLNLLGTESALFLKPANAGSSVGVHRVTSESEYKSAIDDALQYDDKILIENAIEGREIECAVLGNTSYRDKKHAPQASVVGEIIVQGDYTFYDYDAKYIDSEGASVIIPAKNLSHEAVQKLQRTALGAYKALACDGMARVDMFLTKDDQVIVNEVNTIPGFTNISMYPKLWKASGLDSGQLLDELIELAMAN